jgi:hypothetical protein
VLTVYISIGNSDDKLTQREWSAFAAYVRGDVRRMAHRVHGDWASLPFAPWQNACWCIEIEPERVGQLRTALREATRLYRQDSIAWAEAQTTFIGPTK